MTPKNVADAFYTGELEAELRRIGKETVVFKADKDRETHMEMVENCRRETLYPHPESACSPACRERDVLHKICDVLSIVLAMFICRLWPSMGD